MQAEMKQYVVVRPFHLGEVTLNLRVGDRLRFDGNTVFLERTNREYDAPTLEYAVKAGHVVTDDGTIQLERPKPITPPLDAPKIIIQDRDEQVVAEINLPEQDVPKVKTAKPPEEMLGRKVAKGRPVDRDQFVIERDRDPVAPAGPSIVTAAEANAAVEEQEHEARVVGNVSRVQEKLNEAMRAEGIGPNIRSDDATMVIHAEGDVQVVGRIKSLEERQASLRQNQTEGMRGRMHDKPLDDDQQRALNDDIQLALAKRTGKAPTPRVKKASVEATSESQEGMVLDDFGYPAGFPRNEHWRIRLQWCKEHENEVEKLRIVYTKSTSEFRKQMAGAFPDIRFE